MKHKKRRLPIFLLGILVGLILSSLLKTYWGFDFTVVIDYVKNLLK